MFDQNILKGFFNGHKHTDADVIELMQKEKQLHDVEVLTSNEDRDNAKEILLRMPKSTREMYLKCLMAGTTITDAEKITLSIYHKSQSSIFSPWDIFHTAHQYGTLRNFLK